MKTRLKSGKPVVGYAARLKDDPFGGWVTLSGWIDSKEERAVFPVVLGAHDFAYNMVKGAIEAVEQNDLEGEEFVIVALGKI